MTNDSGHVICELTSGIYIMTALRVLRYKSVFDEIFPSVEHFLQETPGHGRCVGAVPKLSTRTQ